MAVVVLLARVALAVVFVVSAVAKLRDRTGSARAVRDFGVPGPLVGTVAAALPVLELLCAALLLSADPAAAAGGALALLMLTGFTAAIVANLLKGRRPDCHCFGQFSGASIGWSTVARNGLLLVLAGSALVGAGTRGWVGAELAGYTGAEIAVGLAVLSIAATLLGLVLALLTLMRRYGAVLLRLEALEVAAGLVAPKSAPPFALPDLDGATLELQDVLDLGKPVLVVFISPSCALCSDLVPDLAAWQQNLDHPLSVVVLSQGSVESNRDKLAGHPVRVLLQGDTDLVSAFGVQGTPAAVLLGVDGGFAAPAAHGVGAVRRLHDDTAAKVAGRAAPPQAEPQLHDIGPRPVSPGDPVPDAELVDETGAPTSSAALAEGERVLLFWRTTCGYCASIVADVRALEAITPIVLVTNSDLAEVRATGLTSPVVREGDRALTAGLKIPGTPSAVRVRSGMIDSSVAVGGPGVLALLQASSRPAPLSV